MKELRTISRALFSVALLFIIFPISASANRTSYRVSYPWTELRSVDDSDTTVYVAPKDVHFRKIEEQDNEWTIEITYLPDNMPIPGGDRKNVEKDRYKIFEKDIPPASYELFYGIRHGFLAVPFRFQHDGNGTPGASVGYFAGYQRRVVGLNTAAILCAGLAGVPVSSLGDDDVETKYGLTICGGVLGSITSNLQLGILAGMDHIDANYKYQDRLWLSFSFGFGFVSGL